MFPSDSWTSSASLPGTSRRRLVATFEGKVDEDSIHKEAGIENETAEVHGDVGDNDEDDELLRMVE